MRGFFSKAQVEDPAYKSGKGIHSCPSCGLYQNVLSPKMEPYGEGKQGVMVIGEAPGEDEDRRGKPWQGKAGKQLQKAFKRQGIDLFQDCVSLNAINCRPTDKKGRNTTPTGQQIACCRRRVLNAVQEYKPRVVILQGGSAVSSVIGHRWHRNLGGVNKWRGWAIPDRELGAWVCPTFHPSYVQRQEEQNEVQVLWEQDLHKAVGMAGESLPSYADEEGGVVITEDVGSVLEVLRDPSSYEDPDHRLLAFDLETTGLKPYNTQDHQVATISFCAQPDQAYAIPMPTEPEHLEQLREILEDPAIGKIAANMMFEDNWMVTMYGIKPYPWVFDTMQAAHVLDNRPGITGLKFQVYVRFGLVGYDEEVQPYLKSPSSHEPNRVMELMRSRGGRKQLLRYCGMDSLLEYRLAKLQREELGLEDKSFHS